MKESITDRQRPSYVILIEFGSDKIVKEMGPHPLWKAEKLDSGMNINLNHSQYYTLIVTKAELDKRKANQK